MQKELNHKVAATHDGASAVAPDTPGTASSACFTLLPQFRMHIMPSTCRRVVHTSPLPAAGKHSGSMQQALP